MRLAHVRSTPLAIALSSALWAIASTVPSAAHAKEGERRAAADTRPLIEQSLIVAPRRVGEFELEGSRYNPETKYAGVAFRYRLPSHPEMRIDLFVYPAGLMSEQEAVKAGMEPFLATFEEGVRQRYYDRFALLARAPFEIVPEAVPQSPASEGGASPAPATAESAHPQPIRGERLDLRYRMPMGFEEPVPMRSRGYLFYKQLYYFKGRLTATEAVIGQAEFDALTDRTVRELVPAIRAHNIGACAEQAITVAPELFDAHQTDDALDDALARVVAESLAQMGQRNCHQTRAEAEAVATPDAETVVITFDPEDWSGE